MTTHTENLTAFFSNILRDAGLDPKAFCGRMPWGSGIDAASVKQAMFEKNVSVLPWDTFSNAKEMCEIAVKGKLSETTWGGWAYWELALAVAGEQPDEQPANLVLEFQKSDTAEVKRLKRHRYMLTENEIQQAKQDVDRLEGEGQTKPTQPYPDVRLKQDVDELEGQVQWRPIVWSIVKAWQDAQADRGPAEGQAVQGDPEETKRDKPKKQYRNWRAWEQIIRKYFARGKDVFDNGTFRDFQDWFRENACYYEETWPAPENESGLQDKMQEVKRKMKKEGTDPQV